MAQIREPIPVKLICGVTFVSADIFQGAVQDMESIFSSVQVQSPVFDFSAFTSYYEEEMGKGLQKAFLCFESVYDPASLPACKVKSDTIEKKWAVDNRRRVNLDPGYLTAAKLVLATAKDFAHRIYIGQGIYGDVQLRFRQGRFEPSKWTYPDYQTDLAMTFFGRIRSQFLQQERHDEQVIGL
ncbi:DUF4416 family protein [bacterium]|nr:DUF4416 family protein [bacterium]